MLLESIQSANKTLKASMQFSDDKQAAKNFITQVYLLSQYTTQIEQILDLIKTIQTRRITSKVFTSEIKDSLQVAVDTCGEKLSNNSLDASTVSALKNSIELCKKNVEISWIEAAAAIANDIESSLKTLKNLLPNKQKVEAVLETMSKSKNTLPGSSKVIEAFLNSVNQGKELIDGLHLDDETEKFINKVRTQQATVADLTPHIMEWLNDNKLLNMIKIRF